MEINFNNNLIFNKNIKEIEYFINLQNEILQEQIQTNTIEINQLILLAQCNFEIKSKDSIKKSIEYYKQAMDLIVVNENQIYSSCEQLQIDYSFILANYTVSLHYLDFINSGGINKFKLGDSNEIYNLFEKSLKIMDEINYRGIKYGQVLNMYCQSYLYGRSSIILRCQQKELEIIKSLVNKGFNNLTENCNINNGIGNGNSNGDGSNSNNFNSIELADSYLIQGCLNHKREYFNKSLEILVACNHDFDHHPKIANVYYHLLYTLLDDNDLNTIAMKALKIIREYYCSNHHFEILLPLNAINQTLLYNKLSNLEIENQIDSIKYLNGINKLNKDKTYETSCCIL